MKLLRELNEENWLGPTNPAGRAGSADRYAIKHESGAYVSIFSFGDNKSIANAKLFPTKAAAEDHAKKIGDKWTPVKVTITIREK